MDNKLSKKCPNCGAEIEHNYNHKCPYCRTYLHITDDKIKKINNCDIRVDKIEVEGNPIRYGYIVTIRGFSTPKLHYLEEFNDNSYILSGDDIAVPIGYKIEVPMEIIYNDFEKLAEYIYNSIPPQLCNGYNEDKILSECLNYFCNRR